MNKKIKTYFNKTIKDYKKDFEYETLDIIEHNAYEIYENVEFYAPDIWQQLDPKDFTKKSIDEMVTHIETALLEIVINHFQKQLKKRKTLLKKLNKK